MPRLTKEEIAKRAAAVGLDVVPRRNGVVTSVGEQMAAVASESSLSDREKALTMKLKAKKTLHIDVRLPMYERILAMAETFDEDVSVVARACLINGLEYYEQWARPGEPSPFGVGASKIRRASQLDPSGRSVPQNYTPQPFQRPPQLPPQEYRDFRPPQPRETITETVEPVFQRAADGYVEINGKRVPMGQFLPSGATVQDEAAQMTEQPRAEAEYVEPQEEEHVQTNLFADVEPPMEEVPEESEAHPEAS